MPKCSCWASGEFSSSLKHSSAVSFARVRFPSLPSGGLLLFFPSSSRRTSSFRKPLDFACLRERRTCRQGPQHRLYRRQQEYASHRRYLLFPAYPRGFLFRRVTRGPGGPSPPPLLCFATLTLTESCEAVDTVSTFAAALLRWRWTSEGDASYGGGNYQLPPGSSLASCSHLSNALFTRLSSA